MAIRIGSTAPVLAGALALTLVATAALAAPAVGRAPAKVADAAQGHVTTINDGEDDAGGACSKARKRLWVEGEGWIVRKVTTCR